MKNWSVFFLTPLLLIATSSFAQAFQLDPYSKFDARSRTYEGDTRSKVLELHPIHEKLTLKAIAAAQIEEDYKTDAFLEGIVAGIRWNDDPLNMVRHRPQDWYASYTDSCDDPEEIDPDWDLLYRTHCGDMQFLHAMASSKKETAGQTKERILMWLEFTFKVASGQIDKDWSFRSMGNYLETRSATLFKEILMNNGKTRDMWQPEWIFTLNCDRRFSFMAMISRWRLTELSCSDNNNKSTEQLIQNIALGSLIHVLQDSFSGSHVLRIDPAGVGLSKLAGVGKVVQFGNYAMQAKDSHDKADLSFSEDDHTKGFDLTNVTARIIELAVQQRADKRERWGEAEQLFDNLFEVVDTNKLPGDIGYR